MLFNFGVPFSFIEQDVTSIDFEKKSSFFTTLINPWVHSIIKNLSMRFDSFILSVFSLYVFMHIAVYYLIKGKKYFRSQINNV
jgi:hypothetical protein